MRLAIDRPSPVEVSPPVGLRRQALEAAEQARHVLAARGPGRLSLDADRRPRPRLRATRDVDGGALRAVLDRVADQVVDRLARAGRGRRAASGLRRLADLDRLLLAVGKRAVRARDLGDERAEVDRLACGSGCRARRSSRRRSGRRPCSVRRFAESRIWPICAAAASFARRLRGKELGQHLGPAEDDAERVLEVVGDGAEDLALEAVGVAQLLGLRRQGARSRPSARGCGSATRSSRPAFACCSCSYRMTLSKATESRLQNTSTSARSVSDRLLPASRMTTTSRPLPVPM